jgi:outer membrane protein
MNRAFRRIALLSLAAGCPISLAAQLQSPSWLPNAPVVNAPIMLANQQTTPLSVPMQVPPNSGTPAPLTRIQAEQIALANNPRVRVADLLAKVQHQVVREVRSNELPNASGNLTAVEAQEASRLSAGSLTSSALFEHAGMGVQLSQLVTDFGRTQNLVASEKLQEKARLADAEASREDIVLATDEVFYHALQAQATLRVATETVNSRQTLVDQVSALTSAKLKSDLDLSFAQVNLSQAKLLQLDAQNNVSAAKAALSNVLGYDRQVEYQLVDDSGNLAPLPPDAETLIATAIQSRPDLQSLRFNEQAAHKFSRAQAQQLLPTINAVGVVGATPVGSSQYFNSNWYGAVGVNMSVPIFNGFRFNAQAAEARLNAQASAERTRDRQNRVARDVRTAWLDASTALQRVTVTGELLKQANTALDLSKTRYQLGLSSIVELSQAQLQQTQAAISDANARSQYGLAISVLHFQMGSQP